MVIEGFANGADGVMVLGCHPGDCHYKDGNYSAAKRAALLAPMLEQFNIEPARFKLDWVSAGEGEKFARVVNEMYEGVAALGPLKLQKDTYQEVGS
jgi:F420-non-reducing hydrogenase iron-sulfur subunit